MYVSKFTKTRHCHYEIHYYYQLCGGFPTFFSQILYKNIRHVGRETRVWGEDKQHITASRWSDFFNCRADLPLTSSRVKITPSTISIAEITKILMGCLNLIFLWSSFIYYNFSHCLC